MWHNEEDYLSQVLGLKRQQAIAGALLAPQMQLPKQDVPYHPLQMLGSLGSMIFTPGILADYDKQISDVERRKYMALSEALAKMPQPRVVSEELETTKIPALQQYYQEAQEAGGDSMALPPDMWGMPGSITTQRVESPTLPQKLAWGMGLSRFGPEYGQLGVNLALKSEDDAMKLAMALQKMKTESPWGKPDPSKPWTEESRARFRATGDVGELRAGMSPDAVLNNMWEQFKWGNPNPMELAQYRKIISEMPGGPMRDAMMAQLQQFEMRGRPSAVVQPSTAPAMGTMPQSSVLPQPQQAQPAVPPRQVGRQPMLRTDVLSDVQKGDLLRKQHEQHPEDFKVIQTQLGHLNKVQEAIRQIVSREATNAGSIFSDKWGAVGPGYSGSAFGWGATGGYIPGGHKWATRTDIERLKSMFTVEALNEMRATSKTGGAVGQVTEKEWQWLAQTIANLSMARDPNEVLNSLMQVIERIENQTKPMLFNYYYSTYGPNLAKPGQAVFSAGGAGGSTSSKSLGLKLIGVR